MSRREQHTYSRSAEIVKAAKRRKRRMTRLSVMILTLLLSLSLTGGIVVIAGSNKAPLPEYKYYTTVEIQAGDTLWGIASEYYQQNHYDDVRDYVRELKRLNRLTSDKVISGDTLVVSYYSTEYK